MEARQCLPPRSLFSRAPCCKFSGGFAPIALAEILSRRRGFGWVQDHVGSLDKVFDYKISCWLHVCKFSKLLFENQYCAGACCSTSQKVQLPVPYHETSLEVKIHLGSGLKQEAWTRLSA